MADVSTFLFADIAGFTALTEAHGDEEAADLALDFCERVGERLAGEDGEIVKTIGDAVMVRCGSAAVAVRLGLEIADELMADHGRPTVRVGMHTGPATVREGDWFGATVNLAARIAGAAAGGEVLVSEAVRFEADGHLPGVVFAPRGNVTLRNVSEPVLLHAATRQASDDDVVRVLDPVCHMAIVPGREAARVSHAGREHLFCSLECAQRFTAAPDRYAVG